MPAMLDEGVRRLDMLYAQALERGLLRPDPSLVIIAPPLPPVARGGRRGPAAPTETGPPVPTGAADRRFNIQVATPDAGAVQQAEVSVSRVDGVTSAITTSLALGGTSMMRVDLSPAMPPRSRPRCRRRAGRCRSSAATR